MRIGRKLQTRLSLENADRVVVDTSEMGTLVRIETTKFFFFIFLYILCSRNFYCFHFLKFVLNQFFFFYLNESLNVYLYIMYLNKMIFFLFVL